VTPVRCRLQAVGLSVLTLLATFASIDAAARDAAVVVVTSDRSVRIDVAGLDPAVCCNESTQASVVAVARDGRRIPLLRIGVDRQVVALPAAPKPATIVTRVHLLLAEPLVPQQKYRLRLLPIGLDATLVFDPRLRSPVLAVNQLGYVPTARKIAFVGDWLGTAGPLPVLAGAFDVIDAKGVVAFRGALKLRQCADPWSGNDVHVADFSALKQNGRYHLRVAGVGVSDEFEIRDDVYDAAYRNVMRVFLHQRNGTAVDARHAAPGYARSGGVPPRLDGVFDAGVAQAPLGQGEREGAYRALRHGWFDAGDYGQYVPNAAPVWFAVGLGFDLDPGAFRDNDLNLPESGNGLPDVLDELEWGFDWLLAMQDARDGGVYFRVASERWDDGMPSAVRSPRLISEKTTHATASFAAAAAIHARLLQHARPERALEALVAAEKAWAFLEQKPQYPAEGERYRNRPGMHAGEYADGSALDNRLWAAAELLRTTGEDRFLVAFERDFARIKLDPTNEVTYSEQGMGAVWAYLQSTHPRRAPATVQAARKAVLAGADWRIRQMEANAWLAPAHPRRALTGWGNFAHSTRAALTLLQAYHLTQEPRYRDWAWLTPGPQLGLNPQGLTYITGLGTRSPQHPLSKLSQHAAAGTPLPGLPVHGPHARLPGTWPTTRLVTAAYWPAPVEDGKAPDGGDGYPVLRRYTDSDQLPPMSEPTVAEIARIGVAFGLLRDGASLSRRAPSAVALPVGEENIGETGPLHIDRCAQGLGR
jgi:Glycosyl hydrolase family 9/Cellulase N-terminal ig-like domain